MLAELLHVVCNCIVCACVCAVYIVYVNMCVYTYVVCVRMCVYCKQVYSCICV